MKALNVFRCKGTSFQKVGALKKDERGAASFAYDCAYLAASDACPISAVLPLRDQPFGEAVSSAYFSGLLPEGSMRLMFAQAFHAETSDFEALLSRLNNESAGALLFSESQEVSSEAFRYEALSKADLQDFASKPREGALVLGMGSRLSIAGAQAKVGLYHAGDDMHEGWFKTVGGAATTHIVKASAFRLQTVNEALCLAVAGQCGFDVAQAALVPVDDGEPLLAVRRFDRPFGDVPFWVDDLPMPERHHQEDFHQLIAVGHAQGYPLDKYEPTEGNYLSLCARQISEVSSNPFGDKAMLFGGILLDYLLGNCDNHLKNHAMLWDAQWQSCTLSPLYDITHTLMYPIDLEMGVSLCASRKATDVTEADIRKSTLRAGLGEALGWEMYRDLKAQLPDALDRSVELLADQGFGKDANEVAASIKEGLRNRCV